MLPPPLETDEEKCCLIALVDKNVAMSKEQAKKQLANAKEQYGKPFQYEEQLRAGLERQAQINAELEVADKPHDEAVMGDYSNDENEEMEM